MLPRQRSRGQARNCGRTVCAPTKNVIRCGGRNISAPPKTGFQYRGRIISAPTKSGNPAWGTVHVRPMKNGNPVPCAERIRPMRGVSSAVGAGPRPARRARLLFTAAPRRGGPCGRPPQHTPRPLGMYHRAGCGPNIARRRSRGQARNRGRTLCAPTKNVIRCGGRNISAPPNMWFQYRGRNISAPTKSGHPTAGGRTLCAPTKKR